MILGLRLGLMGEGAALAERAALDFVFLDDPGEALAADPLSVAAFLMTTTTGLGLVASVPTRWAPFNVARALASFDNLSGGRLGWSPWPSAWADPVDAARAAEHLDVVFQLFDSWDDDALVFDKVNAVFADSAKVRRIQHAGAYFTVDGPLNAPRPPQGHPVLVQPIAAAGPQTDVILVSLDELDGGRPAAANPSVKILADVVLGDDGESLAGALAEAYLAGACDGVLLGTARPVQDAEAAVLDLVRRLRLAVGAEPRAVQGDLRARLDLPRPRNRFSQPAWEAAP
jgi:alkanesulfonate monooxygenase SsuD/methylene tetrahydromethanopterin reductase-like flavin-dependent oxidoreductase (luciferase family)